MAANDSDAELLEEMLKRAEVEFFPKFRRYIEHFIDLFNHVACQEALKNWMEETKEEVEKEIKKPIEEINQTLAGIKYSESVFDILKRLRIALRELSNTVIKCLSAVAINRIGNFFDNLLKTGYHSMLLDEELSFLNENKGDIRQRAEKLVSYIKRHTEVSHGSQYSEEAFKKYIILFEEEKRKQKWKEEDIRREIKSMRRDFDENAANQKDLDKIIDDISSEFEPLRIKLNHFNTVKDAGKVTAGATSGAAIGAAVGALFLGFGAMIGAPIGAVIGGAVSQAIPKHRREQDDWFNNTRFEIIKYLNDQKTDDELKRFLHDEELESDIDHFKTVLIPWIDAEVEKNKDLLSFKYENLYLPKKTVMLEVERMSKFLYAVVLNKPDKLRAHQYSLADVIKASVSESKPEGLWKFIPCVSFGQIPLLGGQRERIVQLTFILDQSRNHNWENKPSTLCAIGYGTENVLCTWENALQTIKLLFPGAQQCQIVKENGINLIKIQIKIEDSVATLVANSISKLSDLSIRGVLVGNFGFNGFRHALNPMFNRIYSVNCADRAEGFIHTFYTGSLDRGGEPYFCPNGWRRFAIDVGMTGAEFERSYGNWPVAYHGTEGNLAMVILLTGLRASDHGCFINPGEGAVYLSPSIEYSGHPRYARIWRVKTKYVQMVLQVRVNKKPIFKRQGTIKGATPGDPPMDSNFKDNMELEWVIKWPPGQKIKSENGIVVYGLMLRVTDIDPSLLPCNKWWGDDKG